MDYDPVNREAPAPRYELESGSEDELDHDGVASTTQEPLILSAADGSGNTLEQGVRLVVLVSNAGVAFLSSLGGYTPRQQYILRAGSEQHASIAVVGSSSASKVTVALVAPPPQLRSSRFHESAQTIVHATRPSSILIVDSYSPEQQLYRGAYSEEEPESDAAIRYLATSSYLARHKIDEKSMHPLRSPESASGLGAAFLSKAVVNDTPAMLTLLEDKSFQSHVQLYGSSDGSKLSPAASNTLASLAGLDSKTTESTQDAASRRPTLLDFVASRRVKPAANLAVLGDGNMYI